MQNTKATLTVAGHPQLMPLAPAATRLAGTPTSTYQNRFTRWSVSRRIRSTPSV